MATYKGIQGYSVQKLSSDPTVEDTVGQLWYNSDSGAFKISTSGAGAWASGGSLNTGRVGSGGAGTQTAANLTFGFTTQPGGVVTTLSETYDGTTWTEGSNGINARTGISGCGTSTATLYVGGSTTAPPEGVRPWCETYNGTSWTEVGDLQLARMTKMGTVGTSTAAMSFAGGDTPIGPQKVNEEWDGTSWTEGADLNTARRGVGALGIANTAAICAGGQTAPPPANVGITESWNGTAWTEVNNMTTARSNGVGAGTVTSGLVFGGNATTLTENYDGTSWTEVGDMAVAREQGGAAGGAAATTAALSVAGDAPGLGYITLTEEWNDPVYTIKTVTVS